MVIHKLGAKVLPGQMGFASVAAQPVKVIATENAPAPTRKLRRD
jgi:hypothetical protein